MVSLMETRGGVVKVPKVVELDFEERGDKEEVAETANEDISKNKEK